MVLMGAGGKLPKSPGDVCLSKWGVWLHIWDVCTEYNAYLKKVYSPRRSYWPNHSNSPLKILEVVED